MRTRAIAAVIALSCAGAAPLAGTEAVASPVAQTRCVHARIGGHAKCLAPGQKCAQRYQAQYARHGFFCLKQGRKYHLIRAGQQ